MVVLKNIKKNNSIIECDYYPEGGDIKHHMKVDIATGDIVEDTCSDICMAIPHVKIALNRLKMESDLPNEKTEMWY